MRSENSIYNVLKHKAFALCGAAFCAGMLLCTTASCEKAYIPAPMLLMYEESIWLPDAQLDSIYRFTKKLDNYVLFHPDARQDEYYKPTIQNVNGALAPYGYRLVEKDVTTNVDIDTTWAGEHFLNTKIRGI